MKKILILVMVCALLGCVANQGKSHQQMQSSLEANKSASTRLYPGKSPAEVMQASHKALYMLDPGYDMAFDISENKIYAKRAWVIYLVVWSTLGLDQYNVSIEKTAGGSKSTLAFSSDAIPIIGPPNSFKKGLEVGHMENPADFKLFHDRVEYLLGLRNDWVTCESAKAKQKDPSKDLFLCDSIGLENISPNDDLAKNFK